MLREIVFDTETTGLDPANGDRLIELGCIEIVNRIPTGREFHRYVNPERDIHRDAVAVHGLTGEFLKDKPLFKDVADEFLDFIGDAPLVAHNASFDLGFINAELERARHGRRSPLDRVVDTLALARRRHPAGPNSLDALCKRYGIDLSQRTKHGALPDSLLLANVYVELLGERQANLGLAGQAGPEATVHLGGITARQRPVPLPSRLSPETEQAHRAFVRTLGRQGPLAALRRAGAAKLGHLKRSSRALRSRLLPARAEALQSVQAALQQRVYGERSAKVGDGLVTPPKRLEDASSRFESIGVVGLQLQRLLGVRQTLGRSTRLEISPGASAIERCDLGCQAYGLAIIGNSFIELGFLDKSLGTIPIGCRNIRTDRNCFAETLDRSIMVFQMMERETKVVMCGRKSRIEGDGLVEVHNRSIVALLRNENATTVAIGGGQSRIQLDGLAVVGNRSIELAFVDVGRAAIGVGPGKSRIEVDSPAIVGDRSIMFLIGSIDAPTIVMRYGMLWVEADRLVAVSQCPCQSPLVDKGRTGVAVGVCGIGWSLHNCRLRHDRESTSKKWHKIEQDSV